MSDHGESLGEKGLFLHGMPYAIAPDVQTQVPMVMWLSRRLRAARRARRRLPAPPGRQPLQHDHLFHTVLGLLDVRTALYEPRWDFSAACRARRAAAGAAPLARRGARDAVAVAALWPASLLLLWEGPGWTWR